MIGAETLAGIGHEAELGQPAPGQHLTGEADAVQGAAMGRLITLQFVMHIVVQIDLMGNARFAPGPFHPGVGIKHRAVAHELHGQAVAGFGRDIHHDKMGFVEGPAFATHVFHHLFIPTHPHHALIAEITAYPLQARRPAVHENDLSRPHGLGALQGIGRLRTRANEHHHPSRDAVVDTSHALQTAGQRFQLTSMVRIEAGGKLHDRAQLHHPIRQHRMRPRKAGKFVPGRLGVRTTGPVAGPGVATVNAIPPTAGHITAQPHQVAGRKLRHPGPHRLNRAAHLMQQDRRPRFDPRQTDPVDYHIGLTDRRAAHPQENLARTGDG